MVKKKESLLKKFALMFIGFVVIAMILNVAFSYYNQTQEINKRFINNLENTAEYVMNLMSVDGQEVSTLKGYFMENYENMDIPLDYNGDYTVAFKKYNAAMAEKYPGKTLFHNIAFDELDADTQYLWAIAIYEKWLNTFEKARDSAELKYAYFIYAVSNEEMQYMIDGVRLEKEDKPGFIDLGFTGVIDKSTHENMWKTWNDKTLTKSVDSIKNEFGNTYTYYYPVEYDGSLVGLVCTEADIDLTQGLIDSAVGTQSLIFLLVLVISSLLIMIFISTSVLKRISQLDRNIQAYSETKNPEINDIVKKYVVKNSDEISNLGSNFTEMTSELEDYMINLQTVTAENEKISTELGVASDIQHSMLPQISSKDKRYDIFGKMDPAKEVGGDFYDYFMVDEDHAAIIIADVSGKGVPAALFMVIAKTMLKNNVMRGLPVDEAFTLTNNQLGEGNTNELFVTAWLGIIDLNTGVMDYVEAGHDNPIIVHSDGKILEVTPKAKRMPLAAWEGMKFIANQIQLQPNDTIVLYTDGVPEATNASDELYGMDRYRNILTKCNNKTPKEVLDTIRNDVDEFVGEAPQFDDLTMLAFKWNN